MNAKKPHDSGVIPNRRRLCLPKSVICDAAPLRHLLGDSGASSLLSHTLFACSQWAMQMQFLHRTNARHRHFSCPFFTHFGDGPPDSAEAETSPAPLRFCVTRQSE
jgi:hypothetical protein